MSIRSPAHPALGALLQMKWPVSRALALHTRNHYHKHSLSSATASTEITKVNPPAPPSTKQSNITSPPPKPSETPDPNRPSINNPLGSKGPLSKRNVVISSAVKDPFSFIAALSRLLQCPEKQPTDDSQALDTAYWTLGPRGDTITRSLVFQTDILASLFCDRLAVVSDEMDHHARLDLPDTLPESGFTVRRVTCTTHRPPGLSMRDIRLAKVIDDLADTYALTVQEEL